MTQNKSKNSEKSATKPTKRETGRRLNGHLIISKEGLEEFLQNETDIGFVVFGSRFKTGITYHLAQVVGDTFRTPCGIWIVIGGHFWKSNYKSMIYLARTEPEEWDCCGQCGTKLKSFVDSHGGIVPNFKRPVREKKLQAGGDEYHQSPLGGLFADG